MHFTFRKQNSRCVFVCSTERSDQPAAVCHLYPMLRAFPNPQTHRDQKEANVSFGWVCQLQPPVKFIFKSDSSSASVYNINNLIISNKQEPQFSTSAKLLVHNSFISKKLNSIIYFLDTIWPVIWSILAPIMKNRDDQSYLFNSVQHKRPNQLVLHKDSHLSEWIGEVHLLNPFKLSFRAYKDTFQTVSLRRHEKTIKEYLI